MRLAHGRSGRRKAMVAVTGALALLLSACSSATSAGDHTVTSFVTAGPESEPGVLRTGRRPAPRPRPRPAPSTSASPTATQAGPTAPCRTAWRCRPASCRRSSRPGEKPPQFIVVSFDGVGWHEKWQHWFDVGKQVPFRFTGFLSGTYMLSDETKMAYQGPGHSPGKSSINWNSAADLPVRDRGPEPGLRRGQRDRHPLQRPLLRGRRAQRQSVDHGRLEQRTRPVLRAGQERQGEQSGRARCPT